MRYLMANKTYLTCLAVNEKTVAGQVAVCPIFESLFWYR